MVDAVTTKGHRVKLSMVIAVLVAYYGLFFLLYLSPLSTALLGTISIDQVPDLQKTGYTIGQTLFSVRPKTPARCGCIFFIF